MHESEHKHNKIMPTWGDHAHSHVCSTVVSYIINDGMTDFAKMNLTSLLEQKLNCLGRDLQ